MAAVNENFNPTPPTGNVSNLNYRVSKKCRGNFFPLRSKEAPRFGPFRSPMPAFLPVEGAMVPVQSVRELIHHLGCWRKPRPPDRAKPHGNECAALVSRPTEDLRQSHR